jgi:CHAD domain-containing protein
MGDGAPTELRERELKFDVPDGWELPDPASLAPPGGSVTQRDVALESTYFDTPDHALLGARLTLRRRGGDEDEGWQLKVPNGDARTEVRLPPGSSAVPSALKDLTAGIRTGAPLRPVARLQTNRAVHVIVAADATPLAELVVDDVRATSMGDTAVVRTWREVEVELKEGDEALLQRAAKWLRRAGARPSSSGSKLARALQDGHPPTAATPRTVQSVLRSYLAEQHQAIRLGDVAIRMGKEAVHPTRVATRRYRTVLKVFADRLDPARAAQLDEELKWYANALGGVRDLQVLDRKLHAELARLPVELVLGPVAARLRQTLDKERADAQRALDTVMRSRRYAALLRELRDWSHTPPFVVDDEPARRLDRYLRAAEKKVGRRLHAAEAVDDKEPAKNDMLHRARKAAKRARYTAELSAPVLGKRAKKAAGHAKKRQRRLGDRQDAVLATAFLRRVGAAAGTTPGENGFTFGILLARMARHGDLESTVF